MFLLCECLYYTSALKHHLLHCCCLTAAQESLLSLRDRGGPCPIPAHSLTSSLAAAQLQEGNILTLKRWATHYNSLFPSTLPLLAPGAGKRGETFCALSSHRCSLENLHWAFAKQESSPGLYFSEAENRHLLWETDLKNASDTVFLKSSFSSLCMIFKMPCQMDVSSRYFFLGVMNEITLLHLILSVGEQGKILYLYCPVQ